jgi:hypothetical protein
MLMSMSLLFLSCGDDPEAGYVYETVVNILYQDQNGNNLFDSDLGLLSPDDIHIYYMKNGIKEIDYGGGFIFISDYYNEGPVIKVDLNDLDYNDLTLIKLGDISTDTIKAEYSVGKHHRIATKIWYNSELVYDVSNPTLKQKEWGNVIEIKKDNFK